MHSKSSLGIYDAEERSNRSSERFGGLAEVWTVEAEAVARELKALVGWMLSPRQAAKRPTLARLVRQAYEADGIELTAATLGAAVVEEVVDAVERVSDARSQRAYEWLLGLTEETRTFDVTNRREEAIDLLGVDYTCEQWRGRPEGPELSFMRQLAGNLGWTEPVSLFAIEYSETTYYTNERFVLDNWEEEIVLVSNVDRLESFVARCGYEGAKLHRTSVEGLENCTAFLFTTPETVTPPNDVVARVQFPATSANMRQRFRYMFRYEGVGRAIPLVYDIYKAPKRAISLVPHPEAQPESVWSFESKHDPFLVWPPSKGLTRLQPRDGGKFSATFGPKPPHVGLFWQMPGTSWSPSDHIQANKAAHSATLESLAKLEAKTKR
jgi:hypothetical protein